MSGILRDPATGFDCTETPFVPPKTMGLSDVTTCSSCSLVFTAPIPGPKSFSMRPKNDGIGVDESPLAMLTFNGSSYSLFETVLWKNGAHRNFKANANYDLELNLYFHDIYDSSKQIAMAIPITIDNSQAKPYFTEMANQNVSSRQYSLETIIVRGSPVLTYKGIDLRNRNNSNPTGASQCNSINSNLTWFVIPSTYISQNDATRIRGISTPSDVSPPAPDHELALERARQLTMTIAQIQVKSDIDAAAKANSGSNETGIYLTRALQCQRIDPSKDIKDDAVYLKNPPVKSTLADELDAAAALDKSLSDISGAGMRPKDIENILAICVGIAVGIIIFGIIAYFVLQNVYTGYLPTIKKELEIIPEIISAREEACKAFIDIKKS